MATVSASLPGGTRNVTAIVSDAQARTVNLNQGLTINPPLPGEDPLILGIRPVPRRTRRTRTIT